MRKKLQAETLDALFDGILTLQSEEECYAFFDDLCTPSELKALAQRFEVARMLSDGYTYVEVAEKTGASSATVSRVNRCLENGTGGYATIIDRYNEKHGK